uniref:Lysosomal-associated transmembrane protein 4B n=1 Tax=Acrobeloides nanus TaxID=290746 RepID=A0A914CQQ3_9BILA
MVAGFLRLLAGTVDSYNHTINYYYAISGIVVIVACSLVIYADVKEKAWAYIPFLVVQALAIIGYLIGIFLILIWGITLPQWLIDSLTQQGILTHDQIRIACFIAIVILFVVEVLAIWFWSIVFRAYRYMSGVLRGPSLVDNYA